MAGHKSPLRDRLLSNSPDPIKSSILRESGMGWNSSPSNQDDTSSGSTGSITSPLRIAKRESPARALPQPQIARRTSSSYKHVRNNNLVSKSPFKSQIPTPLSTPSRHTPIAFPSTRRVSGEKRPRPSSMHEQAETENERPFSLKRERRQSKGFQGLIQKEPVTRSPFKQRTPSAEEHPSLPSLSPFPVSRVTTPPYTSAQNRDPPVPEVTSPARIIGASPARSSLVSRRMHGPRLSGGGRRERRKTVTFDERCDVVEFDREEETDEEMFDSVMDREGGREEQSLTEHEGHHDDEDPFYRGQTFERDATPDSHYDLEHDSSYESIQLSDIAADSRSGHSLLGTTMDPDASISGLVNEIFFSSNPTNITSPKVEPWYEDGLIIYTAPNRDPGNDIPTDMEVIDGVVPERPLLADRPLSYQLSLSQSPSSQVSPHQRPNYFSNSQPASYPVPDSSNVLYVHPPSLSTQGSPKELPVIPLRHSPILSSTEGDIEQFALILESPQQPQAIADSPPHSRHSTPPLFFNRTTPPLGHPLYAKRALKARLEGNNNVDVNVSPESSEGGRSSQHEPEEWVTRFGADTEADLAPSPTSGQVPFTVYEHSIISERDSIEPLDPGNLLISTSEVSFNVLEIDKKQGRSLPSVEGGSGELCCEDVSLSHTSTPPSRLHTRNSARNTNDADTGSRSRNEGEVVNRRFLNNHSSESREFPDVILDDAGALDERDQPEEDREKDRLSVVTTMTDLSAEMATIERARKLKVTGTSIGGEREFGLVEPNQRLQFDFGSKFGLGGLGIGSANRDVGGSISSRDSMGMLDSDLSSEATGSVKSGGSMRMGMGDVDVDMDMRSALDRLMDDVAGTRADDSMTINDRDSFVRKEKQIPVSVHPNQGSVERAATDTALLHNNFASRNTSGVSITAPPPVPPKDNIRSREQLILEKRREAKRMEEDEGLGYYTPPKAFGGRSSGQALLGVGRPTRRRSMSTGDVNTGGKQTSDILLDLAGVDGGLGDDPLADSIDKELKRLVKGSPKSKYNVREREGMIYASSSDPDRVSHVAGPGDLNTGRAWRMVRRPSDMNEYSKEIKEYRAQEKPGKAYGKVFVKVLGVKGMHLPLPQQPTALTCTLNNGIHFVSTPDCPLGRDCRIEQEFELIEHSKLEFTLTLKVRRDPHIIAQFKAISPPPPPPPPPVVQTSSRSGMRSFFSSSPKKTSKDKLGVPQSQPPIQPQRLTENLARYLKSDGTLARAFISFKDIAFRCDTRLFETSYPLIGQRVELGGRLSTLQVGEIVLQMFRLPPLPGIPPEQLPQSLEECHRGLRHINWHKVTYFEGTLTQSGGDCSTWRRRQLRVIGANLVAFNDVTKKATATIDLKKALAVEDDQESRRTALNSMSRSRRYVDDYDGLGGVERSFRLVFPHGQEIMFFADTDEEKNRWLDVLRALVGHIPPHPLWAELLWQRQEDLSRKAQSSASPSGIVAQPSSPYSVPRSPFR
ncbi:hypothetical protein BDZ94DRAFT_1274444 [Collybia nuda]|uniref:PH domain-containing protein n=1 Tax=Collybia nuda TaxID=64659 RepID=A0A9P5XSJ1_9AGAR|nr:hypothetical protein BDZ94DRAFT_1274444 [Collybia nuda]